MDEESEQGNIVDDDRPDSEKYIRIKLVQSCFCAVMNSKSSLKVLKKKHQLAWEYDFDNFHALYWQMAVE